LNPVIPQQKLHKQKPIKEWSMGILLSFGIGLFSCCFLSLFVDFLQIPNMDLLAIFKIDLNNPVESMGIWTILVELALAPFFEELIFRKLLYGFIRTKMHCTYAAILASFIFAIFHLNLAQMMYTFLLSLILCEIAERTANFYFCVIAHFAANLLACLMNLFEPWNRFVDQNQLIFMLGSFAGLVVLLVLLVRFESVAFSILRDRT